MKKKLKYLIALVFIGLVGLYLKNSEGVEQKEKVAVKKIGYISELTTGYRDTDKNLGDTFLIGDQVTIQNENGNLIEVSSRDGRVGWVSRGRVLPEKPIKQEIMVDIKDENGKISSKDVREVYNLGDLQFAPIERHSYDSNPRVDSRGIYISLARTGRIDKYIKLAEETNINTFVIDVKDDAGRTLFDSEIARNELGENYIRPRYKDITELMKKLKENNIYVVGRVSTFKDEALARSHKDYTIIDSRKGEAFKGRDKISWLTPYDRRVWKYDVGIALEAAKYGFNEITFDYVRFPSGVQNLETKKQLNYKNEKNETKSEAIQRFLKYARDELSKKEVYVNASVFGQVGISRTDENIGQYYEGVLNVVDTISPMAYPSHYANGTFGIRVPDKKPYELIDMYARYVNKRSENIDKPGRVNIWIQGFSAPWLKEYRVYKGRELKEQVDALKINKLDEYLVWNPVSNYYWDGLK